jgi:hypothetical protein
MVDERGFEPPASSLRTVGKKAKARRHNLLTIFTRPLIIWQTWQTRLLFVFPVQFDGEKPDKITRGACNHDKVFSENPLTYSAGVFRVSGMN